MTPTLDLEAEALLAEYNSLREEIGQRVQNQLYIVGGNLALLAAASQLVLPDLAKSHVTILALLTPQVFYVVAWLYFEQDVFLTQAATYLHQRLRPAILVRIRQVTATPIKSYDVMGWEDYRNEILFKKRMNRLFLKSMTVFRLCATLGPGVISLGAIIRCATFDRSLICHSSVLWYILFGLDVVGLGLLVLLAIHILDLYAEIGASPHAIE